MKGYLVDTNIFLRLLTEDDLLQTPAVKNLIANIIDRRVHAYVTIAVILEMVWTLESYYELKRNEVAEKLSLLLNTPNLVIENQDVIEEAVEQYKQTRVDFADCYNASFAKLKGDGTILSYDRHFDKLAGVKRKEPS